MSAGEEVSKRIPVILVDPSALVALDIFNANEWTGKSKGVIWSCAAILGAATFAATRIREICSDPALRCGQHLQTLSASLGDPSALERAQVFGQDVELHNNVLAFFANVKGTLDLAVQLLAYEGICGTTVHGFHEKGERLLNSLERNSPANKQPAALRVIDLIRDEKNRWIDRFVEVRDMLIHPEAGFQQLMFEMDLEYVEGRIVLKSAHPLRIDNKPLTVYSWDTLGAANQFLRSLLACLRFNSGGPE